MCYTEPVFTKRRNFFIHQYVHPCLSKNPKYTFYTIKSSLTLAYYSYTGFFRYQDISGPGHLGSEYMRQLGTRYLVLEISVLNNKNNLIEFENFLKNIFTCRRCLYKFVCVFFNHL